MTQNSEEPVEVPEQEPQEAPQETAGGPLAGEEPPAEAKPAKRGRKAQAGAQWAEVVEGDSYLSVAERVSGGSGEAARALAARLMRANFYRPLRAGQKLNIEEVAR